MSQREKEGVFFKIDIGNNFHSYGRIIIKKYYAFYDCKTYLELPIDEIRQKNVLFIICVFKKAVTSGRWQIIGYEPLENEFLNEPVFFMQDALNEDDLKIYLGDGVSIPATIDSCKNLERLAVWDPEHVEDRLRDYYLGLPNKWVESMKLRI